jgi:hypothetical protein
MKDGCPKLCLNHLPVLGLRGYGTRPQSHFLSAWPSYLTSVDSDDCGVYDALETKARTHKQYPVTF